VCSRNFLIEEGLTGSDGNVGDIVYFKELVCSTLSAVKIEKYGAYSKRKQHKAHFCHYAFDKFVDEVERTPRPTVSFLCCVSFCLCLLLCMCSLALFLLVLSHSLTHTRVMYVHEQLPRLPIPFFLFFSNRWNRAVLRYLAREPSARTENVNLHVTTRHASGFIELV